MTKKINIPACKKCLLDEGADPATVDAFILPFTMPENSKEYQNAYGTLKLFEVYALKACEDSAIINQRRKHKVSAREIGLRVRLLFEINNNHIPLYARLFVRKHAWTRDYFELRTLSQLKEAVQTGLELRGGKAA